MHIALYPDLINEYFKSKDKYIKSDIDLLRTSIIDRPDNCIVLSGKYLHRLEEKYPSDSQYYNDFAMLFLCILDNNDRNLIVKDAVSNSLDEAFMQLEINYPDNLLLLLAENPISGMARCAAVSRIVKPNYDWLLFELASKGKLAIHYYEFGSDSEIKMLFDSFFKIPQRIDKAYYFDRYCEHISIHNYLDGICHKSFPVEVYTYGKRNGNRLSMSDLKKIGTRLKAKIGTSCQISYTFDQEIIHERRIAFHNLILEVSNDFAECVIANLTWKIDIFYCGKSEYSRLLSKIGKFTVIH